MTLTLTTAELRRACAVAPGAVAPRESRPVDRKPVDRKPLLSSPAPLAALPPPVGPLAAALTVDDLRRAPSRPRALSGQSFGQSFHYWYGRSGRRYLFSEIDAGDLDALDGAVVLVPGPDADRPAHVGLDRPSADRAGGRVFVHLLAETEADRAAVVADLAPRAV